MLKKFKDYFVNFVKGILCLLRDPTKIQIAIRFFEAVLESINANKSENKKGPTYLYGKIGQDAVELTKTEE